MIWRRQWIAFLGLNLLNLHPLPTSASDPKAGDNWRGIKSMRPLSSARSFVCAAELSRTLIASAMNSARQGVEVMDGDPLGWEWKLS